MLCRIYRRKLSGAIDSGQPMSGAVKRHLLRCASCREFAGLAEAMGRRLSQEAEILNGSDCRALAARIKSSLGDRVEAPESRPATGLRHRPTLRLRPVLTAAAALAVVGAGVLYVIRSGPSPTPDLNSSSQIGTPGAYLVAAIQKVNSPYEKEMQLWKQMLDGAAERLKAAFDVGLQE